MTVGDGGQCLVKVALARSERFELPTLGFEVRCSIQLSYERINVFNELWASEPFPGGKHLAETTSGPPRLSELGGEGYWRIARLG
jgi:hypothetical protein